MAAQTFNRWSRHGVWERLLHRTQQREGVKRGMAFLDGTTIRAHQKAAGAAKKRLSWLSSVVSVFDDPTRRAPAQGWRAAPAPCGCGLDPPRAVSAGLLIGTTVCLTRFAMVSWSG